MPDPETENERKIAICGTAPSTVDMAPYGDDDWEIWGCTRLYKQIGDQWDRWFEMHRLETVGKGWSMSDADKEQARRDHIEWLEDQSKPVYVIEDYADRAGNFQPYPIDEVREYMEDEFGDLEHYYTTSIAYMLALAIYMDVDRIGLYGVDMSTDSEYIDQRPSVEYFVGLARGAGIPVHIPAQSDILKTPGLYGYETHKMDFLRERIEARREELGQRKEQAKNKRLELGQERAAAVGQFELLKQFWQAIQNGGVPEPDAIEEQAEKLKANIQQIEAQQEQMKQKEIAMAGALDDVDYVDRCWAEAGHTKSMFDEESENGDGPEPGEVDVPEINEVGVAVG